MIKDVEPLLKECEETLTELLSVGNIEVACYVQGFINSINKLPDVKKPHGEWVYKKFDEKTGISDSYFCSHCDFPLTGVYNSYCAVCGADMRIKKEDGKKKSCLNCGSSECELGNRARYGFCGNWTKREGEDE